MVQVVSQKTAGETVFETYLNENGIRWEPAPARGTRPDYLLSFGSSQVVCEVEDFGEGAIDRHINAVLKARMDENERVGRPRVASTVGSWDSNPRIQQAVKHAAEQLRPFKADCPCVVVLYNAGSFTDLGDPLVMRALFGSAPGPNRTSGLWQRAKNTTVSAVAIIEHFRPNEYIVETALSKQNADDTAVGLSQKERIVRGLEVIEALNKLYGRAFLEEAHPRLRVVHNPFAVRQLAPDTFIGPRDEHTFFDAQSGLLAAAWSIFVPTRKRVSQSS